MWGSTDHSLLHPAQCAWGMLEVQSSDIILNVFVIIQYSIAQWIMKSKLRYFGGQVFPENILHTWMKYIILHHLATYMLW